MKTTLESLFRGDPFSYSGVLDTPWVQSQFTAGFKFTLRNSIPESSIVTDEDADVVDQATSADNEIVFSDTTHFTITLPSSRTTLWPNGKLCWDFQASVDDDHSYTLASGEITILGDVTRAP